jgi:hypothetical protein
MRAGVRSALEALRFFRFHPALGGHANDGDSLSLVIPIVDEPALVDIFVRLGTPLDRVQSGAPVAIIGRPYSNDEWMKLARPIPGYPHFDEPRTLVVAGVTLFPSVNARAVTLHLPCAAWSVGIADVRAARAVETALVDAGISVAPRNATPGP